MPLNGLHIILEPNIMTALIERVKIRDEYVNP